MLPNISKRSLAIAFGPISLLAVSGCGGLPVPDAGRLSPKPVVELGQEPFTTDPASYALRPNDTISVNVFREPDLSADGLQVDPDGFVSLPLIGRVQVEGKSAQEAAQVIAGRLQPGYLRDPRVSVNIKAYGSHMVSVEGAVTNAGLYEFKPGTRLSSAIAMAGGTSNVAKLSQVAILRRDENGLLIAKFDYGAVSAGTMMDPLIASNDRIVVGTSGLSQAYRDFLTTLPILAVFARFTQ